MGKWFFVNVRVWTDRELGVYGVDSETAEARKTWGVLTVSCFDALISASMRELVLAGTLLWLSFLLQDYWQVFVFLLLFFVIFEEQGQSLRQEDGVFKTFMFSLDSQPVFLLLFLLTSVMLCLFTVEYQRLSLLHSSFLCRTASKIMLFVSTFDILPVLSVSLVISFNIHASLLPSLPPSDYKLPGSTISSSVSVINFDRVKNSPCFFILLLHIAFSRKLRVSPSLELFLYLLSP